MDSQTDMHSLDTDLPAHNGTPGIGTTGVVRSLIQGIDGLIAGNKWNSTYITYGDPDSTGDYQSGYPAEDLTGFSHLSAAQIQTVHEALNVAPYAGNLAHAGFSVEGFTNLTIDYQGPGAGNATLRFANNTHADTAYGYYPSTSSTGGDVWFGNSGTAPVAGNYDYHTVLHEAGHALGLKHGQEGWGYGAMPHDIDSMEYSVMTYKSYVGSSGDFYTNENFGYAQTYMMYDIAALQHMYGADFNSNAGDTVYSWSPTTGTTYIDGQEAIEPGGNRIFATIWDGNGNDTYDLSNYATDVSVNLNPGEYSVFSQTQLAYLGGGDNNGNARGNIFNALQYHGDSRSLIENASGGSGNDDLVGNAAANILMGNDGNDDLTGFAGNDVLNGGAGNDWLDGHVGDDAMYGGTGDDIYYVDSIGDVCVDVSLVSGGGHDLIFAYLGHTIEAGIEDMTLVTSADVGGTGNELGNLIQGGSGANLLFGFGGADLLHGQAGNDVLRGGDGNDQLFGEAGLDELRGEAGNDRLIGGGQADVLFGGLGNDTFDFDKTSDSAPGARDVCRAGDGATAFQGAGVSGGDLIDLLGIDANTGKGGNQAFAFGGTGAGHVWAVNEGANTVINGNVDADATVEFQFVIEDAGVLAAAYKALDFIL